MRHTGMGIDRSEVGVRLQPFWAFHTKTPHPVIPLLAMAIFVNLLAIFQNRKKRALWKERRPAIILPMPVLMVISPYLFLYGVTRRIAVGRAF
jgi:hypothetical protein